MFLGIDVGGTKLAAGLVSDDGAVRERRRESIDQSDEQSAVQQIVALIERYGEAPRAIGVCIPGIADQKRQTVWAPNIKGWNHIHLLEQLSLRFSCPIIVESDRNAAVLGEVLYGCARGKRDVVFMILGTGIGAGVLSGGQLIRGSNDIGGAVGWIPVCARGQRRHFEDIAAGPAIEHAALELFRRHATLPELASLARHGNRAVLELFEIAGEAIGLVLSMFVSIFNPELIVVGGGVSACWDLLSLSAMPEMRLWGQPIGVSQVEVVVSQLSEDAGILGAAAVARGL
ncbi:MAG: ROK family protein [Acidobacteria bacterium]|nr:MAG: ROK family protein [Acidobacteriota bacterium]